uniref:Uncharacterized protein n=1 Tax=Arundo donax TaxID=35708 RepID=A0A0A9H1R0_ARUDO
MSMITVPTSSKPACVKRKRKNNISEGNICYIDETGRSCPIAYGV